MLAMQYSFVLPADYDMAVIRQRIADKGHLLDHFPGLGFKAYLSAERRGGRLSTRHNLYAPFYLWNHSDGMNAFLGSSGFVALTQAFGWPVIQMWSAWHAHVSPDATQAICASRDIVAIPPYTDLDELRQQERQLAQNDIAAGALATVSAFEPTQWNLIRFRLWGELRAELVRDHRQLYDVGHVSLPQRTPAELTP